MARCLTQTASLQRRLSWSLAASSKPVKELQSLRFVGSRPSSRFQSSAAGGRDGKGDGKYYALRFVGSRPSSRFQSSAADGKDGKGGSDNNLNLEFFPNSWAEPETLFDWSKREVVNEDQDKYASELGHRNAAWREQKLAQDPEYFTRMAKGQAPKYLWIGCCDSRVAAENMIGAKPGEIFVHRNIANQVIHTDANLRACLQYAIHSLEVEHIVVCGHYDCGGIRAATRNTDHTAPLESWLTNIRDVYKMHYAELQAIADQDEREKRLVELNVQEQCMNLFKTNDVQKRRVYTAQRPHRYAFAMPRIHAMVFAPGDGILRRLPLDFGEMIKKHSAVYKLYDNKMFMASNVDPAM